LFQKNKKTKRQVKQEQLKKKNPLIVSSISSSLSMLEKRLWKLLRMKK